VIYEDMTIMPNLPIIQTRDANGIDHLFLNQP